MWWRERKEESDWEAVSYASWCEAESLSYTILLMAEKGYAWSELKKVLGPRPPHVVDRAFHMAMYSFMAKKK
jgi:hypothetical protein